LSTWPLQPVGYRILNRIVGSERVFYEELAEQTALPSVAVTAHAGSGIGSASSTATAIVKN